MSKATALFAVALLLFVSLTHAARPEPSLPTHSPSKTQPAGLDSVESCDGVGEEECAIRRALADAHTDYIYTQDKQP
ncbi:PREDICTED: phytosulfokines 3-like [Nelumbo nucifera]|uniref:Phytosulfokine n=2 Tax=Nelumbo nucifera TaxID=4432 RepID=A0A822ZQG9_NELNU|nr:PREDICTED: phytosulfokines 3-like [Nelumbo nucifera]DAD48224.1 TPA_asm: hypothetical protein HUJ06_018161 [Nelumbo nucifera]